MAVQPDSDATLSWQRSSASQGDGACVEVATLDSSVLVRDSRDRPGVRLSFGQAQWHGFVRRVRQGEIPLG